MSKHPTPKKKTSKARGKRRYASFKTKAQRKLVNIATLVTCKSCGSKCVAHSACPDCGKYRGRQVIDKKKKIEKITKIKA
ncbi:MAG: 50S ribosomal protein L32 [Candidatus Peregrinibacteria bacterium]|nr:50S ribosomal protein L32 [Candidatus Peregrinibacteria bacterium]